MYVPRTEHRANSQSTELIVTRTRVIALAPNRTVVRRSLLFSMYRTLRTVHVQDQTSGAACGTLLGRPTASVQSAQPLHVAVLGEHLGLEPAHELALVCLCLRSPTTTRYQEGDRRPTVQHRWYPRTCQTTVHRLLRRLPPILVLHAYDRPDWGILQTLLAPSPSVPVHR